MIQAYDQTWQLALRVQGHTSRQEYVRPLCIIRSLHDFLLSIPNDELIYDFGCGDNNLKLFYGTFHNKNIIGIDTTIEADIYNLIPTQFDELRQAQWYHELDSVNYITAINSMHFGKIERNLDIVMRKLKPGGKLYFTANDFDHLEHWRHEKNWSDIGNVKYFWCGLDQLKEQKDKLIEAINNDKHTRYRAEIKKKSIDEIIDKLYNKTIENDHWFGVLRVIIEKKNV